MFGPKKETVDPSVAELLRDAHEKSFRPQPKSGWFRLPRFGAQGTDLGEVQRVDRKLTEDFLRTRIPPKFTP